jgi:hypothetical protein
MAVVGAILSARDGILVAADAPNEASGANNDTIQQINPRTACYLYGPESRPVLDAYLAAANPVPVGPLDTVQSLSQYLAAHPPTQRVGFAIAGLQPNEVNAKSVQELVWTGQTVNLVQFPGNLMLGAHSVARYLNDRMYGFNSSLELAKQQAAFLLGETRVTLQTVRPHIVMATIDRANGFLWVSDDAVSQLIDRAYERSCRLQLRCVDLF